MSGRRARPTDTQLFAEILEHLRLARSRRKGHTESKTFIVGGDLLTSLYIPPLFVGIDHDGETPEWKRLTGFAGVLGSGTCTIDWLLNGSSVATLDLSSTPATVDLTDAIDLAHGDTLRPSLTAASLPVDLSAAAYVVTAAR